MHGVEAFTQFAGLRVPEPDAITNLQRVRRTAAHWLEHNYKAEKFLLWVDCFDVHEPWDPPAYFVEMYDRSGYSGPPMFHPNYGPASDYTEAELQNLRAHYAGEVTLISKHVGRLLRMVEDTGLMDRTAILFMADHGMYLGEHDRCGKSNISPHDERGSWPFYDDLARVPLLIYAPGVTGGSRVGAPVQPPDIMPTLLDLAGAAPSPGLHGHSLVPLLRGEQSGWPRRAAFSGTDLTRGEGKSGPKVTVSVNRCLPEPCSKTGLRAAAAPGPTNGLHIST